MDGLFTSLFSNGTIVFRTKLHIWHSTFQSSSLAGHRGTCACFRPKASRCGNYLPFKLKHGPYLNFLRSESEIELML